MYFYNRAYLSVNIQKLDLPISQSDFYLDEAINPPNIAPKIILDKGFEVIGQEPLRHPTSL